jgi:hypothetical protein
MKHLQVRSFASLFFAIVLVTSHLAFSPPFSGAGVLDGPQCVAPPAVVISWWPGDGTADDIVGGHNGTLENNAKYATGFVCQAFSFGGVNDFVDVGEVDLPSTFSVEAWVFPNDTTTFQIILSKDNSKNARSYYFEVEAGGTLAGSVRNTGGQFTQYRTTDRVVTQASWQHVVMTYDGSAPIAQKMAFYVDGIRHSISVIGPDGSPGAYDNGGTPEQRDGVSTKIGIITDDINLVDGFNGLIDELTVYSRVLSAAEIVAVFNAGSQGKCKPFETCPTIGPDNLVRCLKDNVTGNIFKFNSTTGDYVFTRCQDGFTVTGTGTVRLVNGVVTLTDSRADRRVSAGFNTAQRTGSATIYLMIAPGVWQVFRINDTTSLGNGCRCGG